MSEDLYGTIQIKALTITPAEWHAIINPMFDLLGVPFHQLTIYRCVEPHDTGMLVIIVAMLWRRHQPPKEPVLPEKQKF